MVPASDTARSDRGSDNVYCTLQQGPRHGKKRPAARGSHGICEHYVHPGIEPVIAKVNTQNMLIS